MDVAYRLFTSLTPFTTQICAKQSRGEWMTDEKKNNTHTKQDQFGPFHRHRRRLFFLSQLPLSLLLLFLNFIQSKPNQAREKENEFQRKSGEQSVQNQRSRHESRFCFAIQPHTHTLVKFCFFSFSLFRLLYFRVFHTRIAFSQYEPFVNFFSTLSFDWSSG